MSRNNHSHILLIDSDESLRRDLEEWLVPRGFQLSSTDTAEAALSRLQAGTFDLVILAMLLVDRDGLGVCREISRSHSVPVLMVSDTATPFDEVAGLESGADDFLAKPLVPEITLARVRALLRRSGAAVSQEALRIGDLHIDRPRFRVTFRGDALPLTPTEFKLLTQLALVPGAPLSREALLRAVWTSGYIADKRLIDTHMRNLRRKLREAASTISIYGVRGIGYRLAAEACTEPSPEIGHRSSAAWP